MRISLGILTIGSLYWDSSPVRIAWRNERLNIDKAVHVHAPIRYGRKSQSRGNSYTMVISPALYDKPKRLGTAIVLPCKNEFEVAEQIIQEAELLWTAERKVTKPNGALSATWGSVGLKINPEKIKSLKGLSCDWAERVAKESNYGGLKHANNEDPAVTESGGLNLSWPNLADGSELTIDALLITATNPEIKNGKYAKPKIIAQAWKEGNGAEFDDYYWNNRKHGIQTFQDKKIEKFLSVNKDKKGN